MRRYNVVLIVIDTLRADHAQGLDKLLDLGFVKYEDVYATAPWTLPSHASMFTGMYPSEHGIHETREYQLPELLNIARARMTKLNSGLLGHLKDEGYTAYIVTANVFVTSISGFNSDFEYVINPMTTVLTTRLDKILDQLYAKKGSRVKALLEIVKDGNINMLFNGTKLFVKRRIYNIYKIAKFFSEKAVRNKGGKKISNLIKNLDLKPPFFLFINIMEAHSPHNSLFIDRRRLRYIGKWLATGQVDPEAVKLWKNYPIHAHEAVKRALDIVETLKTRGYWDDTMIIVTSDHGELLGDGGLEHIYSLLDGNLLVPLYVKYPYRPKRQRGFITLADIPKIIDPSTEEVGRPVVIAETHGNYMPFKELGIKPDDRYFHHKIRVISQRIDFIYDATADVVEKIFRGQKEETIRILKALKQETSPSRT